MPRPLCVITGANAGIGRATALELADRGFDLVLIGRSEARTQPVLRELEGKGAVARFVQGDLTSLASVAAAAEAIDDQIHVLINNAGVGGRRGITEDGFELAFGVNHLAHHLLTRLLAPRVEHRIVTVSSNAHHGATDLPLDSLRGRTRSLTGFREYQRSKLANVLFSRELSRRNQASGVSTYAVHPGMVSTKIWRLPPRLRFLVSRNLLTPEDGARTSVWCATDGSLQDETGKYYARSAAAKASSLAEDDDLALQLWEASERWVSDHL